MIIVAVFRLLFDVGVLLLFLSLSNPRHDYRNPFAAVLQYSAIPFSARLFPDIITIGTIGSYEQPVVRSGSLAAPSPMKLVLPIGAEVTIELIDGRNGTSVEEFLTIRDNSFKFILNITILVFMYLGTLLAWVVVRKAHLKGERMEASKMRNILALLLYFCICSVWVCCNSPFLKSHFHNLGNNRYACVFMLNCMAWTFLAVSCRAAFHCIQLAPPKTSAQCGFLQIYMSILNVSVWYSFVAIYFAYSLYKPSSKLDLLPFDENLLVSTIFLACMMCAPPYRYRYPLPKFLHVGKGLPLLQERLRKEEKMRRMAEAKHHVRVEMEVAPPAYEH